jgi:hypothetical protein
MIPLYGCSAHSGKILQLDDESVFSDQGNAYAPYIISTPIGVGVAGYGRFRRFVQAVPHEGEVTVTVTPYRDGAESGPAIVRPLAIAAAPYADAPMAAGATQFQIRVALSAFTAAAELGRAELHIVAHRGQREP